VGAATRTPEAHVRRHPTAFRLVSLLTLIVFTASCATTQLPPISAAGDSFEPLPDEEDLWDEARAEEEKLLDKVRLYHDPLLDSYLAGVVGRLTPPGMAANPAVRYRVRVIEDPTLNAFAYPHGSLYVHTGLLARMDNEDQIATVLGHEMTHVENRHMLRYRRSAQNKQIGLMVAAVAAAVVVADAEADAYGRGDWGRAATIDVVSDLIVGLGLGLAFLASINGYGRALELEADDGGFAKMDAAGYDVAEAPEVYEALLEDHGEPQKVEAFFFGSHPRLSERVAHSREVVAAQAAAGAADPAEETLAEASEDEGGEDDFSRRIRPVVRDDARLNIDMGRLKIAAAQLDRVREWMPEDPEARFLEGRLRLAEAKAEKDPAAQERLRGEAAQAFREAIGLDGGRPAPHRELGLLLYQGGEYGEACAEMRRYVEIAPEAKDADRIRDYLLELERDRRCG
jgi:beta-barrel assembly-enhancing protease